MTTVILYGKSDGKIAAEISAMLSTYGIMRIDEKGITSNISAPRFLIIECSRAEKINLSHGIIVFIGKAEKNNKLHIKGNLRGIVFSTDMDALRIFKNTDVPVITCGMAEEDTLSLSSIQNASANICINRKIKSLKGNIIEPQEQKINIETPITDYSLLAASAILFCSGEFEMQD